MELLYALFVPTPRTWGRHQAQAVKPPGMKAPAGLSQPARCFPGLRPYCASRLPLKEKYHCRRGVLCPASMYLWKRALAPVMGVLARNAAVHVPDVPNMTGGLPHGVCHGSVVREEKKFLSPNALLRAFWQGVFIRFVKIFLFFYRPPQDTPELIDA